jgi:hypothetical protein
MDKDAIKLIMNPVERQLYGSAVIIIIDARDIPDRKSRARKPQTLITAALVTDSDHPVKVPIRIQKTI